MNVGVYVERCCACRLLAVQVIGFKILRHCVCFLLVMEDIFSMSVIVDRTSSLIQFSSTQTLKKMLNKLLIFFLHPTILDQCNEILGNAQ